MAAKPKSYGDAVTQARLSINQARLADPDEHFPYKHEAVLALIEENPPMGSGMPGEFDGTEDNSRAVSDYITEAIADASRDYIDAQAAYLADPSDDTLKAEYDATRDRLLAARLDHRAARGTEFTIGAAARRAG